jgi:predicted nucleic acid-binding protein
VARVFVDTNVLFPFSLMDLMLTLSEDRVHTMVWSDRLLEEWEHVIVREQRRTAQSAALITATIREFFQEDRVPATAYEDLLAEIDGPDPDDIHHMAAAIAGDARTLITWNLGDFPTGVLGPKGITVTPPDPYLCTLLERQPAEVLLAIGRIAHRKQRPPMTAYDICDALARAGTTVFAQRARRLLDG